MPFGFFNKARVLKNPASDTLSMQDQEILVLFSSTDNCSILIFDNLCEALSFAKVVFVTIDLSQTVQLPNLRRFSAITILTGDTAGLADDTIKALTARVHEGGGIVALCPVHDARLTHLFGIISQPTEGAAGSGFDFVTEFIPGINGLHVGNKGWIFEHSRLEIRDQDLESEALVLVRDGQGNPLAWSLGKSRGRATYWNTEVLFARVVRGILLASVLQTTQVSVSALAGFALFHIDDFPPSMSTDAHEPVSTEFDGASLTEFFFDIWFRDILALREKHKLRFSWYVVIDYDDIRNNVPVDTTSPEQVSGKHVLEERFRLRMPLPEQDECGFHGYNHEPMTLETWPDGQILRQKLELARDLWQACVPEPLPASWVPANNRYTTEHLRTLQDVFPEIVTACSLFSTGEFELGEYREFGPEPWVPNMMQLPRETFGYVLTNETRLMFYSQAAWMGAWTHFIHPDDVYDMPSDKTEAAYCRNPERRNWRKPNAANLPGLYFELDAWLDEADRLYPWLEYVTTTDATARLIDFHDNHAKISISADQICIETEKGGLFAVNIPFGKNLTASGKARIVGTWETAMCNTIVIEAPAGCCELEITTNKT